jgi:hypothetical protein
MSAACILKSKYIYLYSESEYHNYSLKKLESKHGCKNSKKKERRKRPSGRILIQQGFKEYEQIRKPVKAFR